MSVQDKTYRDLIDLLKKDESLALDILYLSIITPKGMKRYIWLSKNNILFSALDPDYWKDKLGKPIAFIIGEGEYSHLFINRLEILMREPEKFVRPYGEVNESNKE